MTIRSLLVANRGEIACRIIRTCQQLGIRTVAVFSDADANALHVQLADTAVHIGPATATHSYLNQSAILAAAQQTEVDAIHPGFGFLAENGSFAQACRQAGFIFVGPSPAVIELMGHKQLAKTAVAAANVPTIPGYGGPDQSDGRLQAEADKLGYPIMVKAAAGGGGKGMRLVEKASDLLPALASARQEAQQAFADANLILERAFLPARHIEVQIAADQHGHIISLGERDCSLQRRQQKLVEEAPAPGLSAELRAKLSQTAVRAAQSAQYDNIGTVEFLLDAQGDFYFLEMNCRLQVEHPVSEMVTGIDLVAWQILLAEGQPLPLQQNEVPSHGHAIEVRLYAEDPANQFLPVTGRVQWWQAPRGDGVRVESGLQIGDLISVHYDPMLAKIIAHGPDRATAVRRLHYALSQTQLLGFTHNIPFLLELLQHPSFLAGQLSTTFLSHPVEQWQPPTVDPTWALTAVSLWQFTAKQSAGQLGAWRNNGQAAQRYRYQIGADPYEVAITAVAEPALHFEVEIGGQKRAVQLHSQDGPVLTLSIDGWRQRLTAVSQQRQWWVQTAAGVVTFTAEPLWPEPQTAVDLAGSLRAPMPGSVLTLLVEPGQTVDKGQPLVKLLAMKMEHTIQAAVAGVVEEIYFAVGDTVEAEAPLLRIQPLDQEMGS